MIRKHNSETCRQSLISCWTHMSLPIEASYRMSMTRLAAYTIYAKVGLESYPGRAVDGAHPAQGPLQHSPRTRCEVRITRFTSGAFPYGIHVTWYKGINDNISDNQCLCYATWILIKYIFDITYFTSKWINNFECINKSHQQVLRRKDLCFVLRFWFWCKRKCVFKASQDHVCRVWTGFRRHL